jgi:Xaa-Pro aminopeptidase
MYAGQSHTDKIAKVREGLEKKKAKALVVTVLDEVAWLFNLRGSDIDYNPGAPRFIYAPFMSSSLDISVFFSYAVVTTDSALLFVQEDQFTQDIHETLGTVVQVRPYETFFDYLHTLPSTLELNESSVTFS